MLLCHLVLMFPVNYSGNIINFYPTPFYFVASYSSSPLHLYYRFHHAVVFPPPKCALAIPGIALPGVDLITLRMSFRVVPDSVSSKIAIAIPRYFGGPKVIKTRDITWKLF